MDERRWNMRVPIRVPVRLELPSIGALTGIAHDISFGGLYVCAPDSAASLQTALMVLVSLPQAKAPDCEIDLTGEVVRTIDDGMAVQFFDYSEREFENIAEHLAAGFAAVRGTRLPRPGSNRRAKTRAIQPP